MTPEEVAIIRTLGLAGVFVKGDFTLASRRKTDLKFEIEHLEAHMHLMSTLIKPLVAKLEHPGLIEVVVGVDSGGIILSQLVARYIEYVTRRDEGAVQCVPSVKIDGGGFSVPTSHVHALRDLRTLIVEDAVTTGGSVRRVKSALDAHRADVYAVLSLITRGPMSARDLGVCEYGTLVHTDFDMTDVRQVLGI